jgi:hypothetical protein
MILLFVSLAVAIAYSIQMTIADVGVGGLGATTNVGVTCPTSTFCQVDKIRWTIQANPLRVTEVKVVWTPAKLSGSTYNVCVELYQFTADTPLDSGCEIQAAYPGQVTTTITLSGSADPMNVNYIRVAIAEQE